MRKIVFIFIFFSKLLIAQKQQPEHYTVYVNFPAYSVRAEVSALPAKFHAIKKLEYYWYYSNKIIHTQGGCDGKLLNGRFSSFYLSNNLKEKGVFKEGLKNGEWTAWFENGRISETSSWKQGLKHGMFITFDESGKILSEANYKNGKLHGLQLNYEQGELKTKQKFRKGKEIATVPKKEKEKQEINKEIIKQENEENISKAQQPHSSFGNKIKHLFHKKEKKKENSLKEKRVANPIKEKEQDASPLFKKKKSDKKTNNKDKKGKEK